MVQGYTHEKQIQDLWDLLKQTVFQILLYKNIKDHLKIVSILWA